MCMPIMIGLHAHNDWSAHGDDWLFWCTYACTREMLRGARIVMHLGDVVILGTERRNLCSRVVCSVSCEKKTLIACPRNLCILFLFFYFMFFSGFIMLKMADYTLGIHVLYRYISYYPNFLLFSKCMDQVVLEY